MSGLVDYIEYYWLGSDQYQNFVENAYEAIAFADACHRRDNDELLVHKSGRRDRGSPRYDKSHRMNGGLP